MSLKNERFLSDSASAKVHKSYTNQIPLSLLIKFLSTPNMMPLVFEIK